MLLLYGKILLREVMQEVRTRYVTHEEPVTPATIKPTGGQQHRTTGWHTERFELLSAAPLTPRATSRASGPSPPEDGFGRDDLLERDQQRSAGEVQFAEKCEVVILDLGVAAFTDPGAPLQRLQRLLRFITNNRALSGAHQAQARWRRRRLMMWQFGVVHGGMVPAPRAPVDIPRRGPDDRAMPDAATLPLSVAVICRDNERTIGQTLDSVRGLARQIVVVDSGSTDGTLKLARTAGAEVVEQAWLGFGAQKNVAAKHCREPWILFLDSDESVEPNLAAAMREALKLDDPAIGGYEVNRAIVFAGRMMQHAWRPEWRLRLVRNGWAAWSDDRVHESLDFINAHAGARIERLRGDLRHDAIPSITAHLAKQLEYAELGAADYIAKGRTGGVSSLVTSPIGAWAKQMLRRQAWRDGWRGWSAASISACATLMKHLVLLERTRGANAAADESESP